MFNRSRQLISSAAAAIFAAGLIAPLSPPAAALDKPIGVPAADADMMAAIETARRTVGVFWQAHDKPAPSETGFALKVAFTSKAEVEHIWLTDVRRDGERMSGRISNEPEKIKWLRRGRRHQFTMGQLSDWMFLRDGRIVGNHTLRAMLKLMPQDRAAKLKEKLADP